MKRHLFNADDFGMLVLSLSVAFGLIVFAVGSMFIIVAAIVFYPLTIALATALWASELAVFCWRRIWL